MKKILLLVLILTGIITINAQPTLKRQGIKVPPPVCYASGEVEKSYIPPPPEFLNRLKSGAEKKSEFVVSYSLFPSEAKEAFEFAVSIWEFILESPVPIHIDANWRSKGENTLASCGPEEYLANFKNAPHKNRYYPIAVAEKITKTEITGPSFPDMTAEFNKNIDWYFGTDGNTPDSLYDFVSVTMHELAHGLGFTGFYYISDDLGTYAYRNVGDAAAFDLLVVKSNGEQLTDTTIYTIPSEKLKNAFTSNLLYANSPVAIGESGYRPRLYAPSEWNEGSSIYHLNDNTYKAGNENSLMTHAAGKGEAIHDPGPLTKGIMADIGWEHMYLDFTPLKDIEEAKPLTFMMDIDSDNEIDTSTIFVVYSTDNFKLRRDTLPLNWSTELNKWTASFNPSEKTNSFQYYINAGDKKNRTFNLPTEAPTEVYTLTIGPDTEKPVVTHEQIPFFLLTGNNLQISTFADDNLGVDTVYIEYAINGVSHSPFGLALDSATRYSGIFNFDLEQLKDGDEITYNVIAKDASVAKNTHKIPFKDKFTFTINEIFDITGGYVNDFNQPTKDFIISDFDIYTEKEFENGALHSPHPYLSPEEDDTFWNFTTLLKVPIVLFENARMSFDEVVLVEPGDPGSNFGDDNYWDFVIVEASKDTGKTWLPIADGYDSGANDTWRTNYDGTIEGQDSKADGTSDWFIKRDINMLQNSNFEIGDTILIRFRLHSDPYAYGWGWAIDNLRIQQPVSAKQATLSPGNINVYPNPFNSFINVTVSAKLNTGRVDIEVYNINGEKIISLEKEHLNGIFTEKIDLGNKSNGMYFLSVKENGKKIFSKKLIKK